MWERPQITSQDLKECTPWRTEHSFVFVHLLSFSSRPASSFVFACLFSCQLSNCSREEPITNYIKANPKNHSCLTTLAVVIACL